MSLELIFTWVGFICLSLIAITSTILLLILIIWLIVVVITTPVYDKLNGLGKAYTIINYLKKNKKSWDKFRKGKVCIPLIDEEECKK